MWLEKSGGGSWAGTPKDNFSVSYQKANSATDCSSGPGTFRGMASTIVYPPPGYTPTSQSEAKYSPWISVACGASLRSAGEPQSVSFDIEFARTSD